MEGRRRRHGINEAPEKRRARGLVSPTGVNPQASQLRRMNPVSRVNSASRDWTQSQSSIPHKSRTLGRP